MGEFARENYRSRRVIGRRVRYSFVPSWTWPGAGWARFGAWRTAGGFTLRYRSHLLHLRWRRG